jgi:hypothetical protein
MCKKRRIKKKGKGGKCPKKEGLNMRNRNEEDKGWHEKEG